MYRKTDLKNSLRVIGHDMKGRDSVALGIWVGAGGRYEEDRIKGTAHFLEHILFKGSAKYSCTQIKELIEGVGGALNAFTSEEQTCYYAKIPARHLERTFDILADMVLNPLIAKKDVEKEKGVIIEEIKMYHDLPQYQVMDILDGLLWPDHPLGKSLPGTVESVGDLTRQDLRDFHSKHYTPAKVVVAACGKIDQKELLRLVEGRMLGMKQAVSSKFLSAPEVQKSPRLNCHRKPTEQMHVALGMPGLSLEHEDRYALNLLNIILGGNMSSRLFEELREKRGLAYSISTSGKSLSDTGMFMVRAGVDNSKLVDALSVILKELSRIKRGGVPDEEFGRAKDYFLGQIQLGLEDTLDHMLWIGESVITRDRVRTMDDVIHQVERVKPADIKRVARQILAEERFNLAVVGPVTDDQENALKKLMDI